MIDREKYAEMRTALGLPVKLLDTYDPARIAQTRGVSQPMRLSLGFVPQWLPVRDEPGGSHCCGQMAPATWWFEASRR